MSNDASMSAHRMPAVSASQALQSIVTASPTPVSFGLESLDNATQHHAFVDGSTSGLPRGRLTELFGPPGSGKTTLCLQACASCLLSGGLVTWIDARQSLPFARLQAMLNKGKNGTHDQDYVDDGEATSEKILMKNLRHYDVPTAAHLVALLLLLSPEEFAAQKTDLIVIDSLATLIDAAYPRTIDVEARDVQKGYQSGASSNHRQDFIASIASKLVNLAAVNNLVVIITNPVVTRIKREGNALLRPALSGQAWETAVTLRFALFRDWAYDTEKHQAHVPTSARFIRRVRSAKQAWPAQHSLDPVVGFEVNKDGVSELPTIVISRRGHDPYTDVNEPARKRPRHDQGTSDANSDSEYGWLEDDIQLAAEGLVDESCLATGGRFSASQAIGDE